MYKKSLKKMLTKRFETRNFVSKGNGYIGPFGEEFNDFPQIQIKKKSKNSHSILNILILFLSYLLSNKVEQNEIFLFDKKPNSHKINRIIKYISFFNEFIKANVTFVLFINIFIISINIMKIRKENKRRWKLKTITKQPEGTLQKKHFQCVNILTEKKNESKNTCELSDDKTIIKEHISIDVNLDFEGQKYDSRNIIILSHSSIKIKFQLGINKFNYINRCIYIYIMKFRFFNNGTNKKNKFSKVFSYFLKFVYSKDDGFCYFIKTEIILVSNNEINECNHSLENLLQIKIITKNNSDESFNSKIFEFIFYNN